MCRRCPVVVQSLANSGWELATMDVFRCIACWCDSFARVHSFIYYNLGIQHNLHCLHVGISLA